MTAETERADGPVVVIGGGLIGLSIAAELAGGGRRVELLEAAPTVGGATSPASLAWVNAHAKRPQAYERLNAHGVRLHRERSAQSRRPWFVELPARVEGPLGRPAGPGAGDPLRIDPSGYADTAAYAAHLERALRADGGAVRTDTRVERILPGAGEARILVQTDRGDIAADRVVVAAGIRTAALTAPISPGIAPALRAPEPDAVRGFLLIARAPRALGEIVMSDALSARPAGRGLVALQSLELERALATGAFPRTAEAVWEHVRGLAAERLALELAPEHLVAYHEAERPLTADGLPAVGPVAPRVHVAVTHSGVTLAPLIGSLVAAELAGEAAPELNPFRPTRFRGAGRTAAPPTDPTQEDQ